MGRVEFKKTCDCPKELVHTSGEDIDKELKKNKITWKHDKKYITAYNSKGTEIYWVGKDQCYSKDQQLDWVAHISEKKWAYTQEFRIAFVKALKEWDLW